MPCWTRGSQNTFQSTLPVWGATADGELVERLTQISIHAPRVGSDPRTPGKFYPTPYFNPRSPCGERLHSDSPHFKS